MSEPWPLYDLFLDLPHPAASSSCPPPFVVPASQEVHKELCQKDGLDRIRRFCFPEHDDQLAPPPPPPAKESPGLNRHDVYTLAGNQRHTFSLQLSTGQRIHGHVRRYLSTHPEATTRYDVGRRGVRALVLLTRASAGDSTYAAILKTVEAISALKASVPKHLQVDENPQQKFLTTCQEQHVGYCRYYGKKPDDERRAMLLTIQGTEFGSAPFKGVDTTRLLLPTSLLLPPNAVLGMTESPILPLLRCLGVPNSLRMISALLSERRVVLISSSPTRLTACARSSLAILAQGQLNWQHLFIPVLPPHLFQYLQAPMPYLVGMLSSNMAKLDNMQELGEVLLVRLDQNELETRGIPTNLIASRIPDLVRGGETAQAQQQSMDSMSNTYAERSAADCLVQDLLDLLKTDKRTMEGEQGYQETAERTVKAVKSAFGKLRKKGEKYLQQRSMSGDYDASSGQATPDEPPSTTLEDDVSTESAQNEVGEEEARIAFAMFFLCAYGDMRWYLMSGPTPQLDRERFLKNKRALDGEALFPLYQNMCQSQMFEQFVKERVEEIRARMPVPKDAPLFAVCADYHRRNQIDFSIASVRRVAHQVAQANPGRLVSQANANARRLAMSLTSNKNFEGNHVQAVAQLVEMSHETSSVLCDVMSVVWMRIRDSRGMNWKHALFALQILRNLLYHGPLAAIPEVTDGLAKIRALKMYNDTMRSQNCQQIQMAANEVYGLLVDRAKLFAVRRECANRRRIMKNPPKGQLPRESRMRIGLPFRNIHAALQPGARRAQVAPAPGGHPTQQQRPAVPPPPTQDLLGVNSPSAPGNAQQAKPASANVNDVLGLFDAQATISSAPPVHQPQPSNALKNPFDTSAPQQQQPVAQQPKSPSGAAVPVPPPQQQQQPPPQQQQQRRDPFAAPPATQQQQQPPPQPTANPFAAAAVAPGTQQPPQQRQAGPPQNRAGPFGGPQPGTTQAYQPMQGAAYPGAPGGRPQQPPPQQQQRPPYPPPQGQMAPPPQQQQPPPNAYPGQQQQQPPQQQNMFAPPVQQQQQQQGQPPRKNLSQFDPMSR